MQKIMNFSEYRAYRKQCQRKGNIDYLKLEEYGAKFVRRHNEATAYCRETYFAFGKTSHEKVEKRLKKDYPDAVEISITYC